MQLTKLILQQLVRHQLYQNGILTHLQQILAQQFHLIQLLIFVKTLFLVFTQEIVQVV